MADNGVLRLDLVDVGGKRLREAVDVMLTHQTSGRTSVVRAPAKRSIRVPGLSAGPLEVYRVNIDPPSYLAVGRFVGVPGGGNTLRAVFPVDPRKVRSVAFPDYADLAGDARRVLELSDKVLQFEGKTGGGLYEALDDIRRAGFLNIVTKAAATPLTNGRVVSTYLNAVTELRGDRFFVNVSKELREEVKNSATAGFFTAEPSGMHRPPEGFESAGSFKTMDHYGNLQLTFFSNGTDWVADIDIDDAKGLEHLFQVLRNELTDRPTHPYDIHEILVAHQALNPGYALKV